MTARQQTGAALSAVSTASKTPAPQSGDRLIATNTLSLLDEIANGVAPEGPSKKGPPAPPLRAKKPVEPPPLPSTTHDESAPQSMFPVPASQTSAPPARSNAPLNPSQIKDRVTTHVESALAELMEPEKKELIRKIAELKEIATQGVENIQTAREEAKANLAQEGTAAIKKAETTFKEHCNVGIAAVSKIHTSVDVKHTDFKLLVPKMETAAEKAGALIPAINNANATLEQTAKKAITDYTSLNDKLDALNKAMEKAQTNKRERMLNGAANLLAEFRKLVKTLFICALVGGGLYYAVSFASHATGMSMGGILFGSKSQEETTTVSSDKLLSTPSAAPAAIAAPVPTVVAKPKALSEPKQLEFPPADDDHDAFDEAIAARAVKPVAAAKKSGNEPGCVPALKTGIQQVDGKYVRDAKGRHYVCNLLKEGAPESATSQICECSWTEL